MNRTSVVITGASSGIGEAFARRLAPGHDLLLIARRRDRLLALSDEFANKFDTQTEILAADLSQEADVQRAAERIEALPTLALLVNNAGFGTRGRFWNTSLASQEQMHKLHVLATMRLTHAVLGRMVRDDFGAIINVSSTASFVRRPGVTSYSATKAWMTAFTEGLYLDLRAARSNVLVQELCPGLTHSEFHDVLGADRHHIAGPAWWHTAEEVVDASLDGLRNRRLVVVPGWRYRLARFLIPRLPAALRFAIGSHVGPQSSRQLPVHIPAPKAIDRGSTNE